MSDFEVKVNTLQSDDAWLQQLDKLTDTLRADAATTTAMASQLENKLFDAEVARVEGVPAPMRCFGATIFVRLNETREYLSEIRRILGRV